MAHPDRPGLNEAEQIALGETLRKDVVTLADDIGPRSIFAPEGLRRASDFLRGCFSDLGYAVRLETFDVEPGPHPQGVLIERRTRVTNIIAEKRGTIKPEQIVAIGAHYDTPYTNVPGANDNGSGVAAMLEIARMAQRVDTESTIRFYGFVNEEPPFTWDFDNMGSFISAKNSRHRGEQIRMIALDEIGCYTNTGESAISNALDSRYRIPRIRPDSIVFVSYGVGRNLLDLASNEFQKHSAVPVTTIFGDSHYNQQLRFVMPAEDQYPNGWSDHWAYLGFGYPAVLITDTGPFRYGAHYHTESDTPDKIDFRTMASATYGVGQTFKHIAGISSQ